MSEEIDSEHIINQEGDQGINTIKTKNNIFNPIFEEGCIVYIIIFRKFYPS